MKNSLASFLPIGVISDLTFNSQSFTDAVNVDHFGKPHLCGFAARMLILAAPSFRLSPREGSSPSWAESGPGPGQKVASAGHQPAV